MIWAVASLLLVTDVAEVEEQKSLEELCREYHELSRALTDDYAAIQRSTTAEAKEKDILLEAKANSKYANTRIAFKKVVEELGTRSCPVDMEEDFPPLL